jgi:hypothetical protein
MNHSLIIISLSTLSICFLIAYSVLLKKFIDAKNIMAKLVFDNFTLEKLLELQNDETLKTEETVHKENFLKFISESRDWAFEYIETVQEGLSTFIDAVEHDINYFNEYGQVISMNRPDYDAMKRISAAYKELKKLLPEETVNEK